jgi:hypothetical protein
MIKGGSVLQRSAIDVKWRKRLSSLEVEVVGKAIKRVGVVLVLKKLLRLQRVTTNPRQNFS